jgi:diguanylate cyclase (GGDEF)-like protein
MKVLIVEDDPISRRILERNLKKTDHEIFTAQDGIQALKLHDIYDVRIIITDWIMPKMDGLTLCQTIRERERENTSIYTYIIILTAKGRINDIVKGLEAGADDYMTKPFDLQELFVRLRAGQRILDLQDQLLQKNRELEKLNKKLKTMARTDPLMKIGNRLSFHEIVHKVHQQALRYNKDYSIVMCDVDNFKKYNDLYGHPSGDTVLESVAHTIKCTIRETDEVFRYGGEEVVIILLETNIEGAITTAEKIRKRINALHIEHKGSEYKNVTVSCGVSSFVPGKEKWETILEWADQALYEAKKSGRNCVKSHHNRINWKVNFTI